MLKYQKLAADELMQRLNKPNMGASMLPLPGQPDVEAAIKLLNALMVSTQFLKSIWIHGSSRWCQNSNQNQKLKHRKTP